MTHSQAGHYPADQGVNWQRQEVEWHNALQPNSG